MESISTAQFKRALDRATAAAAYTRRITALVGHLAHSGLDATHPLLEPRPEPKRAILLVLAANRGLCAGYNGNIVRLATVRFHELQNTVPEVCVEMAGKRGISAFKFRKLPMAETFTHFNDKPSFAEVDVLATRYLLDFTDGAIDRLDVVYTKFESASRQQAVVETLLPIGELGDVSGTRRVPKPHAKRAEYVSRLPPKRSTSSCRRPRAYWTRWCRPVSRHVYSSVFSTPR